MSTGITQVILDTFKRLGEPATRGELFDMLADPNIDRKALNGRIANLERDGRIVRAESGEGPIRYALADAKAKARKAAPPKDARAEPAAEPKAKRKYTRRAQAVTIIEGEATTGSAPHAEAFTTNTLTLTADQARELAVITLSHPRPLSERMRKTVIELVRIAA